MTETKIAYAGLEQALAISREAHGRHSGRDGRPYFDHVAAVLDRVDHLISRLPLEVLSPSQAEDTRILAVFPDIVEERAHTGIDADELIARNFDPRVVAWVERLSGRGDGVTYIDNIRALASGPDLAPMLVKLADNDHNMDPGRIAALPPESRGIADRYRRSARILAEAIGRRTGIVPQIPILGVYARDAGMSPSP